MSQDQERKKLNLEKKQKSYFGGFVVSLFAVALSNALADAYPVANWFSILFVAVAVVSLYQSYKLTP